uniref:uncharacterized protein LOC107435947 n=1 Tax=Ziziphus jujuba TaxID=326968 RepID=A0A6P3YXP5_ZIZJJ
MALPSSHPVVPNSDSNINNLQQPDHESSGFLAIEEPKFLIKNESLMKEKQISVDPISLRESSLRETCADSILILPAVTPPTSAMMDLHPPSPLLPANPKFLSCSLPNSANSSPRFGKAFLKKKWRNESHASPRQIENHSRLQSPGDGLLTLGQELHLSRSKSCGQGRAFQPSDDFDLWHNKPNAVEQMINNKNLGSFSKTDQITSKVNHKSSNNADDKNMEISDDGFKCGALCLFLPGFGKAKPVRPRKVEGGDHQVEYGISRTVSMEKFECGSWASSAIINDMNEDGDSMNLYFDLPLELIRTGGNDAHSPVTAAFVFDKDRKGVLKNSSTRAAASSAPRKSHESSRHVRFSVSSSPTSYPASPASCITPRLRKAREDFNAFLEAQSA